jgi:hypothetical protein
MYKKKTVYWDIATEARIQKAKKKTKASESKIIRTLIHKTPFDVMVEYLNEDIKLADKIKLNRF